MLNIDRVAKEIQSVGLYDLVLQDVQKLLGKEKPTVEEIKDVLDKEPQLLRDYMQTTVEYNLSNIHFKDIDTKTLDESAKQKAKQINQNLARLREIEKFTLDFEQSSTLVLIFSVEFFVLFSVQYFIVLLDLKELQWWIYGLFALSIVAAWIYANRVREEYRVKSLEYEKLYKKTQKLIDELEEACYINRKEQYIDESDEHI